MMLVCTQSKNKLLSHDNTVEDGRGASEFPLMGEIAGCASRRRED